MRNIGVAFNNIFELSGLIAGEQFLSADSLSDNQKVSNVSQFTLGGKLWLQRLFHAYYSLSYWRVHRNS